jgi:putative ABC transport system substrate-binding protein
MRRRELITLLGGAVAWPLAARAQQRPTPRIGIIDQSPIWDHFRRRLNELGYVDGRDIVIEYRSAQGQSDQLAAVASELADLSVDVIVTSGSAATHAAQLATRIIPIVMIAVGDPERAGFVQSLARPGGNITGNTILGTEMAVAPTRCAPCWNGPSRGQQGASFNSRMHFPRTHEPAQN